MHGGTSKAVFFRTREVPPAGADRYAFLKRVIGTHAQDSLHLDGMGRSRTVTSKIALVDTSQREDADVD
jgi:2-methylaconitate cis-trans-isomerase PrpF